MIIMNNQTDRSTLEVIEKVKAYIKEQTDVLKDKNVWIQGMGEKTKFLFPCSVVSYHGLI